MTNFEYLKETINNAEKQEEIAYFICDHISEHFDCDFCPFGKSCLPGHNGVLYWLNEERGE